MRSAYPGTNGSIPVRVDAPATRVPLGSGIGFARLWQARSAVGTTQTVAGRHSLFQRRGRMQARGARRIRRRGPARPNRVHRTVSRAHVTFVDCRFQFEASCPRLAEAGARSSVRAKGRKTQPRVQPVIERDVVAFPVQNHGWRRRPARKSCSSRGQARGSSRSRPYPGRPREGPSGVDHFVSGLEPRRGLRMGQACQRSPSSRALLGNGANSWPLNPAYRAGSCHTRRWAPKPPE